mgnify:CR=1 FL=1
MNAVILTSLAFVLASVLLSLFDKLQMAAAITLVASMAIAWTMAICLSENVLFGLLHGLVINMLGVVVFLSSMIVLSFVVED